MRMMVVWGVSLGWGWEEFSWGQMLGYAALSWAVYGFSRKEEVVINP